MKPPILLKAILDICFFILLLNIIAALGLLLSFIISTPGSIPMFLNDHKIGELTTPKILLLFAGIFQGCVFLYAVYILRKVVRNFFKKELFTPIQITGLKLAGKLIVLASILDAILSLSAHLILESKLKFSFEIKSSFGSFWLQLALGLFLILLSTSFQKAKNLKDENELTV